MENQEGKKTKSIFITKVVQKTPASYRYAREHRAGNPRTIHKKNFKVVDKLRVAPDFLNKLLAGDKQAFDDLEARIRRRGLSGEFIVMHNRGGPGNPGKTLWGPSAEWYARAAHAGAREVGRIKIAAQREEDAEQAFYVEVF
jgi:hypothetical protein